MTDRGTPPHPGVTLPRGSDIAIVRILIVDDDRRWATLFARNLTEGARRSGIAVQVEQAATSAEALEIRSFDLLVVDFNLRQPSADGLTFLRTIRTRPRHRATPAFLVTGDDIDRLTAPAFQLDAAAISKMPPAALVACVLRTTERIAATPRTRDEARRQFGQNLSDEADLTGAERDIVVRCLVGESWRDIAASRGVKLVTLRDQAKAILMALDAIGVERCGDLRQTLEHAFDDARSDAA